MNQQEWAYAQLSNMPNDERLVFMLDVFHRFPDHRTVLNGVFSCMVVEERKMHILSWGYTKQLSGQVHLMGVDEEIRVLMNRGAMNVQTYSLNIILRELKLRDLI